MKIFVKTTEGSHVTSFYKDGSISLEIVIRHLDYIIYTDIYINVKI